METNDRDYIKKFLTAGTEKGLGDLSMMVGVLAEILTTHEREAVEAERKEWLSGNRCALCGGNNLDSKGLSDVCGKCYQEQ